MNPLMPDVSDMRIEHEDHMFSVVRRQTYSRSFNDAGQPVESWTEVATDIPCGYNGKQGSEESQDRLTIVKWDATIRLPADTTLDPKDRLKLTTVFGAALGSPIMFEIVGPIQAGPTALLLNVLKVDV